jgi:hypothetical protein
VDYSLVEASLWGAALASELHHIGWRRRLDKGSMRSHKSVITFIDLLMILAILLIAAGMFVPQFARKSVGTDAPRVKNPVPVSRPLR